ncbi:hypothetical protein [Pedobacter duraquae]|uniref:Uncharacterized protein n=1 Tax=Pedobacter duraquae TaxID=425511 RepID=A0A4R6IJY8_9SPHI|nr:hypothetical protein [Pedobacter duraquae]TDO22360.1 hypothetical protein CLV32_1329 [Pedobacter duraquae]
MKSFQLKIGGIKEMLSKDQMKKITGGYTGCENQWYNGVDACHGTTNPDPSSWGGNLLRCYSAECGTYYVCASISSSDCQLV